VDFLGHVGGDDFILILRSTDWRRRVQGAFEAFSASIGNCYSSEHRDLGCIPGVDREGRERSFPLMTLSVGVVSSSGTRFSQAPELTERLQRVKSRAKAREGHALFEDRGEHIDELPTTRLGGAVSA
jgi:GGDEF domain-containing protein